MREGRGRPRHETGLLRMVLCHQHGLSEQVGFFRWCSNGKQATYSGFGRKTDREPHCPPLMHDLPKES